MADQFKELLGFLRNGNPTIRQIALQNLAGFSAPNSPHRNIFDADAIKDLKLLCRDKAAIAHDAFSILINISSSALSSNHIASPDFLIFLLSYIVNPSSVLGDLACMLLSNLSKLPSIINTLCTQTIPLIIDNDQIIWVGSKSGSSVVNQSQNNERMVLALPCLIEVFVQGANKPDSAVESANQGNQRKSTCHFLASVFANITTSQSGREFFTTPSVSFNSIINSKLEKEYPLSKLTAFTEHPNNIRRGGVTSTIKNVAFVKDAHRALLAEDNEVVGGATGVNVLPYILLPLCGPEEFDIDEQEALPEVCQLLPDTKEREADPNLRKTHIETLLLLSTTLHGREYLRRRNTYVVIKTAHSVEKDDKLVNLLMREEGEEFVDVNYGLLRLSTTCVKKTLNPSWDSNDATFDISLYKSTIHKIPQLEFICWDKDTIGKDYLGESSIYIDDWFQLVNGIRAVEWSDVLNDVKTLHLTSSRKHSPVSGTLKVRIGLIQHPASSPVDLEREFNESLRKARETYENALMSAPPVESIGTSYISSHSLSQNSTNDSASTERPSYNRVSTGGMATVDNGNSDLNSSDTDTELSISDIEEDEVDDDDKNSNDNEQNDESHLPTPTVTTNNKFLHNVQSNAPLMQKSESQPTLSSSSLTPMDVPKKRTNKLKRMMTSSRNTSRENIPLATTPQGEVSEPNLSSHSSKIGRPRRRKLKRSRRALTGGFNLSNEDKNNILGLVLLEVREASDLPRMKNMTRTGWDMDPFVVISFGKKVFRTRVIRHSLNPTWDEKLYFHVRKGESKFTVDFCVLDWDKLSANDHVGDVTLPLQELVAKAPKSDPERGLYDLDEYDNIKMVDYKLPLKIHQHWEEKHSPTLTIRAKYLPYAAIRQRFWKCYLEQYDADDTGSISRVELTMMLDSLGSTLTSITIDSFYTRWNKNPRTDELTMDQIIQVLENETNKPVNERRSLDDDVDETDTSVSPIPSTPSKLTPYCNESLETTGPLAKPPNNDKSTIEITKNASKVKDEGNGNESDITNNFENNLKISTDFLDNSRLSPTAGFISSGSSIYGFDQSDLDDSVTTETEKNDLNQKVKFKLDESNREKVINIKVCPLCHKGRLNSKAEIDIVTHLAVCASTDWGRLNRVAVSNYVTASQAQRKWISKIANKIGTGSYKLGANSANILVQDRLSGRLQEEKMQMYVRIGIRMLYKGARSKMEGTRARRLLKSMSIKQGKKYDDPDSAREIPNFISFHNLDIDEIKEPLDSFKTFNEFFYRKLKDDARPVESPNDESRLVSAADCRMIVFDTINEATKIWIKGRGFTVSRLLGEEVKKEEWAKVFINQSNSSLCIFRLAPQDYHRFHSPVDGKIGKITTIEGEYYTVNPQAVRSPISIFSENVRVIVPIHTEKFGTVIAVCIGAMMVGSTIITKKEGEEVKRGEEFGYFAFGGSTIVCLFERVEWDNDIKVNSSDALETLVRVGMGIGKLN